MVRVLDELDAGFETIAPEEAAAIMEGYRGQWWIAGGWAMDVVGGRQTREHIDLDLGIYREDVPLLFEALPGLELHAAGGGRLVEMGGPDDLPAASNSIWARRRGESKWLLEFILNDAEGDEWIYRRDPRIRMERSKITTRVNGLDCIRPEIQLLFKAKHMRDRDVADFEAHAPQLGPRSAGWLRDALSLTLPGHSWIERL